MAKKVTKKRVFTEEQINQFKEIVSKINTLEPKVKSEKIGSELINVMRTNLDEFETALKTKGYTVKDLVQYINDHGFPISEFVFKKYLTIVRDERKAKANAENSDKPNTPDTKETVVPAEIKPSTPPKDHKNIDKADGSQKPTFTADKPASDI